MLEMIGELELIHPTPNSGTMAWYVIVVFIILEA